VGNEKTVIICKLSLAGNVLFVIISPSCQKTCAYLTLHTRISNTATCISHCRNLSSHF